MVSMHNIFIRISLSPLMLAKASTIYWLSSIVGVVLGSNLLPAFGYRRLGMYMFFQVILISMLRILLPFDPTILVFFEAAWGFGMSMSATFAVGIWTEYYGLTHKGRIMSATLLFATAGTSFQPLQTLVGLRYGAVWVDVVFLVFVMFAFILLFLVDKNLGPVGSTAPHEVCQSMKKNLAQQFRFAKDPVVILLLGTSVSIQAWISYLLIISVMPAYIEEMYGIQWLWLLAPIEFFGACGAVLSGIIYKKPIAVILILYVSIIILSSAFVRALRTLSVWGVAVLAGMMVFCLRGSISYIGSYLLGLYKSNQAVNLMAFWVILSKFCFAVVRFLSMYVLAPDIAGSIDFSGFFTFSMLLFLVCTLVAAYGFSLASRKS